MGKKSVLYDVTTSKNRLLRAFSLVFSTTITASVGIIIQEAMFKTNELNGISLIIITVLYPTSLYMSHIIYHKHARPILLRREWNEDSYLHEIKLLITLQFGFTFPIITATAYLLTLFH